MYDFDIIRRDLREYVKYKDTIPFYNRHCTLTSMLHLRCQNCKYNEDISCTNSVLFKVVR